MTQENFLALYKKCRAGNCSPEEEQLLKTYIGQVELRDLPWEKEMGDKLKVRSRIFKQLTQEISNKPDLSITSSKKKNYVWWHIAACIAIVITSTLFLINKSKLMPKSAQLQKTRTFKYDIAPGGNKAILILANGESVNLDNPITGTLTTAGEAAIEKLANGRLRYEAKDKSGKINSALNQIITPRGGQYQVTLSDGTQVWLNAESSMKFPEVFSGQKRVVELKGEAYFEVAKNKQMPFIVKTKGQEITVLGTHFNVNAYDDNGYTQTTLLEGSVKLNSDKNQTLLKPGQQAVLTHQQVDFELKTVNTDQVIHWKNGIFSFENSDIRTVMKEVARWYDVDVQYQGDLSKARFGGTVSRFKNISELLKMMELTGGVHFKIEERRIIVMP